MAGTRGAAPACAPGAGGAVRHPIGVHETSSQDGPGTHHRKKVRAHLRAAHQFRRAVRARHHVAESQHGGDIGEDGGSAIAQIEEIGI